MKMYFQGSFGPHVSFHSCWHCVFMYLSTVPVVTEFQFSLVLEMHGFCTINRINPKSLKQLWSVLGVLVMLVYEPTSSQFQSIMDWSTFLLRLLIFAPGKHQCLTGCSAPGIKSFSSFCLDIITKMLVAGGHTHPELPSSCHLQFSVCAPCASRPQ